MKLQDLQMLWPHRPNFLSNLDDKTDFQKNKKVWCAYMRLLVAARDLTSALQEPKKKGCQCNAHGKGC